MPCFNQGVELRVPVVQEIRREYLEPGIRIVELYYWWLSIGVERDYFFVYVVCVIKKGECMSSSNRMVPRSKRNEKRKK